MARTATILWCEVCEDWRPCESVKYAGNASAVGQREWPDGRRAFRRLRECCDCRNEFWTIEINENVLDEKLDALAKIERTILKLKKK